MSTISCPYTVKKNSTMSDANFLTKKNIILESGHRRRSSTVIRMARPTFPQFMDVDYVRVWQKQSGLPGDYNHDNTVDASDYTIWRDTYGQSGIGLPADGSGNGSVGDSDFNVWAANYGVGLGAGSGSAASVPEPATLVMLAMGMLAIFSCRRW